MNNYRGTRRITAGTMAALAAGGLGVGVVAFALASAATSTAAFAATAVAPASPAPAVALTVPATTPATAVAPAQPAPAKPAPATPAPAMPATSGKQSGHHTMTSTSGSHLQTELTPNWAGPVLTGSVYDRATTTFVVPRVTCSSQAETDASFWVGLDGVGDVPGVSATVEQAGVRTSCEAGTAVYIPWTEDYPAGEDDIDSSQFQVNPGDKVSVVVVANATTDTYTLTDVTTGATFTRSSAAPQGATDASAECIAEAPTDATTGKYLQLADFGTVTFSQCTAEAVSPAQADCTLVSGDGCASGSQRFFTSIATSDNRSTKVQAETKSTEGGAFTVTWR